MKLKVFLGLIAVMFFAFGTADAQDYSLTLDHVDGHYDSDPTTLETDVPITFHFRFTNPGAPNEARIIGASNGLRLYSPDGATWQIPTHLPYFNMDEFKWYVVYPGWNGPLLNFNDNLFVNTYSLTGTGADTIGFAGTAKQLIPTQPPGVQPGFSEIVYQISTQVGDAQHGKTLCVDSCFYPPANEWLWSSDTGSLGDIVPGWDGPHCFRIVDPDAPVAGNLVVAPASITDSAVFPASTVRSLGITSSNASALNFSISDDAAWLSVSPTGGSTPTSVNVTLNGSVATVGTHNATITITSPTAPNSPVTVPVTFKVKGPAPVIDCPTEAIAVTQCAPQEEICHPLAITGAETVTIIPPGPYWSPNEGGQFCFTPTVGGAQTYRVTATNASGSTQCDITFNVTIGSLPTVTCPTEPVNLAVDQLGGQICIDLPITDADQVALQSFGGVTSATWDAGQLCFTISDVGTGKIIITATNGCGEANCFVDFNITINKYLEVAPTSLSFTAVTGSPAPPAQSITISETNDANIAFSLSADQGWVTIDPTSGTTPGTSNIGINHGSLTAGDYSAELSITSGDAANSPLIVPITLTVTDVPTARLQVVHNAADPAVALVDVWVNGEKFIPNFAFRTATPFVPVPSGVELVIQVAPAPSTSPVEAVATITIPEPGLTEDVSYVAVANGVIEPAGFEPNPDGADIGFTLFTKANAKENAPIFTDFFFLHGITNGQSVQLWIRGTSQPLVDSMAYGDMSGYISFPPQDFVLDVYDTGDTGFVLGTFQLDLSALVGRAGVLFFSGFDSPENNQDGPSIGLFGALADGTVIEFPPIIPKFIEATPDTLYYSATQGMPLGDLQTFDVIETGGAAIPFTAAADFGVDWVFVDPAEGTTPGTVTAGPNTTDLAPGDYYAAVRLTSDEADNEDSVIIAFTVSELVISDVDSLIVGTGGAPPGAMNVPVPVSMVTVCDLYELQARFMWNSPYLAFDSISLVGSAVGGWDATIISSAGDAEVTAAAGSGGDPVPAGTNLLMTFYFTVDPATPEGFYPVDIDMSPRPFYVVGCPDAAMTYILPTVVPGGLVIKPEPNSVCGYVVDPDGIPIEGAAVELWANFPADGLEMSTFSDETGLFEFNDFQSMPYDLWGYKEGYYPTLIEDINYTDDGIMIVLTPVDPIYETNEWVNFYCDENLYLGELMPVGSVVDAYDPQGTHCGTYFVTEVGKYRFMPVYRDDPYEPGDQGADPGDNIQFYINGLLAVATGETVWTQHLDSWPVCLDAGRTVTHTCELASGWNLVSWPVDHPSDYILDALASIQEDIVLVAGFEKGGLTFDPNLPEFSTLWYVDHLSGYWILTSQATTLEIEGTMVPTNTPIPVTTGWNLVSYLAEEALPTEQALGTIHDDLVVAQGYDGGALTYQPDQGGFNTLIEMGPCFGYWVKCTADGQLVYPGILAPAVAPKVNHDRIAAKGVPANLNTTTRWVNLYSGNLTLNGATVSARSVVTAHNADGDMVGGFTMEKDGHFGFMPVYGDDPSTPGTQGLVRGEEFYLAVDGIETTERFVWTSTGDRIEVFGLTAKGGTTETMPQSYSLNQNYPNPFNPTTTMSFNLPAAGMAKIEIFNVLGKLVAVPFDGMAQAGTTEVVWNGRNRAGEIVSSGIYFYRLTADNYSETKKMTLLK